MPTPSWTVLVHNAHRIELGRRKACAGHEANRTRRLDQTTIAGDTNPSASEGSRTPGGIIPLRWATSFRKSRGDIIPLYPGDFVGNPQCSTCPAPSLEAVESAPSDVIDEDGSPAQRLAGFFFDRDTEPLQGSSPAGISSACCASRQSVLPCLGAIEPV